MERDERNALLGEWGEWGAARWLDVAMQPATPMTLGPGVDLISRAGLKVQVKASTASYPELMMPVLDRPKVKRAHLLVKSVVDIDAGTVRISCWQWSAVFLSRHHVGGPGSAEPRRYPLATMYQMPGNGYGGTAFGENILYFVEDETRAMLAARVAALTREHYDGWRTW
jgi:hypothetical protein